jgi:hypothetical protein
VTPGTCAVIIPVLDRPEQVARVMKSLERSLVEHEAVPYFVASEWDRDERAALYDAEAPHFVVPWERERGDFARKMNHGIKLTEEPWIFLGADDLHFHEGWLDTALSFAVNYGKRVVGTNDLGNAEVKAGRHSTHSLVGRSYVDEHGTADGDLGKALHEGYDHQYVDNEFVETARYRGEFVQAQSAVVEHLHPHWRKGEHDSTYDLALASTIEDRDLFRARRRLWRGGREWNRPKLRVRR